MCGGDVKRSPVSDWVLSSVSSDSSHGAVFLLDFPIGDFAIAPRKKLTFWDIRGGITGLSKNFKYVPKGKSILTLLITACAKSVIIKCLHAG